MPIDFAFVEGETGPPWYFYSRKPKKACSDERKLVSDLKQAPINIKCVSTRS